MELACTRPDIRWSSLAALISDLEQSNWCRALDFEWVTRLQSFRWLNNYASITKAERSEASSGCNIQSTWNWRKCDQMKTDQMGHIYVTCAAKVGRKAYPTSQTAASGKRLLIVGTRILVAVSFPRETVAFLLHWSMTKQKWSVFGLCPSVRCLITGTHAKSAFSRNFWSRGRTRKAAGLGQ